MKKGKIMKICPICGHSGDDLVFNFYCSNPVCQNYVAPKVPVQQESTTKYFFYKKPEIIITNGYGLSIDDIVTSFQHINKQSKELNMTFLDPNLFGSKLRSIYSFKNICNQYCYFELNSFKEKVEKK